MRYVQIILLHFQNALTYKSMSVVWFFMALIDVSILIFFWNGVTSGKTIDGWNFSDFLSYYLFILLAGQFLMTHNEFSIATEDIQRGRLSTYLLKPLSYLTFKLIEEVPWRIMNGLIGSISLLFLLFLKIHLVFISSFPFIIGAVIIAILGFFIAFLFKTILGIAAFWITETRGLFEATEVVMVILMGNIMPIHLLPNAIALISYISPFSYIMYFPVVAFEGKLSFLDIVRVLGVQLIWIVILYFAYQKLWKAGIKKFSAVGQ